VKGIARVRAASWPRPASSADRVRIFSAPLALAGTMSCLAGPVGCKARVVASIAPNVASAESQLAPRGGPSGSGGSPASTSGSSGSPGSAGLGDASLTATQGDRDQGAAQGLCEVATRITEQAVESATASAKRTMRKLMAEHEDPWSAELDEYRRQIATELDAGDAAAVEHLRNVVEKLESSRAPPAHLEPSLPSGLDCVATTNGAWAVVLDRAQLSPNSDGDWTPPWLLDGRLVLVHVAPDQTIAKAPIQTLMQAQRIGGPFFGEAFRSEAANCCDWVFGGLHGISVPFDFDGDRAPEILVAAARSHEGSHDESRVLFTFKHGRVEPYAPAKPYTFSEVRDVTGDGRPDLVLDEFFDDADQCGSGFPASSSGPGFIAHSLPDGTFSTDDAAARVHGKHLCPEPPKKLVTLDDVVCAKLWGRTESELIATIEREYMPWDCKAEMSGAPQKPRAKADYTLLRNGASARVPFVLAQ